MSTFYVKGSGTAVTLTDKEFIAKGGEASIYAKGGTAYRVYHDAKNAISPQKIAELSVLTMPGIIKPTAELLNAKKQHCGEVMPFVTDSFAPSDTSIRPLVLCHLFTNSFCRKNGVKPAHRVKITDAMLRIMSHFHLKDVVMVDPNETNWLVTSSLDNVRLIDTSCVQTAHFPGTAIKLAIHDWSTKGFTKESDRFSLAVVLGWLWVGVHPYLTYNKAWDGQSAAAAMEPRMRQHISFFHPMTEFNSACRPLAEIPSALRQWLRAVLQDGKHIAPPAHCGEAIVLVAPVQPAVVIPAIAGGVHMEKLFECADDIVAVFGTITVTTGNWSEYKPTADRPALSGGSWVVGRTPTKDIAVAASVGLGTELLMLRRCDTGELIEIHCRAKHVFESDGRIYAVANEVVGEVVFNELTNGLRATVRHVGRVADLPTTKVFSGCVIQNLLGRYLLSVFPVSGECRQYQLHELEGGQILSAKYERGVLMVMLERSGNYELWAYRFDGDKQDCRLVDNRFGEVDFCVIDSGVCVILLPGGELRACSAKPGNAVTRQLTCPLSDAMLFACGRNVLAADGRVLYGLTMK